MSCVEMDRQAIERRDFPIVRRGYDPASVDAHLAALAAAVEDLREAAAGEPRDSLASLAGAQVQGILEAAQASAQEIVSEAAERAARLSEQARDAAQSTREQAIATARERVAAVTQATEALLQRVGSMDGEARTLVESLRGGAGRLVGDLEALSEEMTALDDASSGPAGAVPAAAAAPDGGYDPQAVGHDPHLAPYEEPADALTTPTVHDAAALPDVHAAAVPLENGTGGVVGDAPSFDDGKHLGDEDLDGARLVALNMALNGDSREATGRYLADNYALPEPEKLLDEVYAAIEA